MADLTSTSYESGNDDDESDFYIGNTPEKSSLLSKNKCDHLTTICTTDEQDLRHGPVIQYVEIDTNELSLET